MNVNFKNAALAFVASAICVGSAAFASSPKVSSDGAQGYISKISNNGKWGIMQKAGTVEGSITPGGGKIYDLATLKSVDISHSSGLSGVADISDDGQIVVGEAQARPAFYSVADKKWHILPMPQGGLGGRLETVTPDGHYAAGFIISRAVSDDQDFDSYSPVMYDLTTETVIDLPGMPKYDMQHQNMHMTMVTDMSPDGRYLIGRVSQSYIQPPGIFSYVYDRQTASYTPIGFKENPTTDWEPTVPNTYFCDFPYMSPNGEWVVGTAHMVEPLPGSEFPNEYEAVYRYHIPSGEYVCYKNGTSEQNVDGVSILNDGTVTIASPTASPYADAFVRFGNYYVSFDQILKQNYGFDFAKKTGWDNTGKLVCVSDDSMTLVTMTGPQNYFVVNLPDPLPELAAKVDLLNNYSLSPAAGTVMSKLKTFKVKFDRDIVVNKAASQITFASTDGEDSWTALSASVSEDATTTLVVTFRTRDLDGSKNYELTIPAGMVTLKGDASYASKEIKASYKGHDNTPMQLIKAYPAEGANVDKIDLNNNPVVLTFESALAPSEDPQALLYREGESDPYAYLNLGIQGNELVLYPSTELYLFNGTDYRLELKAGSVTDVTGGCPNEAVTLKYHGAHVRVPNPDDIYLLREDCDNYSQFMFYEGDGLNPSNAIAEWGFTRNIPWLIVRESMDTDDMAFAAHSMFSPAGKSNDWMVSPQLFIPDENCYLSFDAQSYLKAKNDVLRVYVYESDKVYNELNTAIINDIRENGNMVVEATLSPGASEEGLSGDWQNFTVKLDKFAGKDVYVAFANENDDQSAIFVDNIRVARDLHYLVSFTHPERVVARDNVSIKGDITMASDIQTFTEASLTLKDAQGNPVSSISESGLNLNNGDVFKFEFPNPLPLAEGSANKYSVEIKLNDVATIVNGTVKNLTFEPYKKVVIEEYSGRDCGNCPQGFVAIENLERLYPGRILPLIIRTYHGDPLGNTVSAYSNYLGMELVGAPSGRINRGDILFPMVQISGDYTFSGASIGDKTWLDEVMLQLSEPAEAEIQFTTNYDAATHKISVNSSVRNAINAEGTNLNIFAVVRENQLDAGYQSNYYANIEDADLGDWGKGGAYSQAYVVPFTINEVARTTWGQTFNGTGGLIPNNLEAGKEYLNSFEIKLPGAIEHPENCEVVLMIIDANTGKVLNANVAAAINGDSAAGIENIGDDARTETLLVAFEGSLVATNARALAAYAADGRQLGFVDGDGCLQLDLRGYKGIVIARAVNADGKAVTSKFLVK